MVTVAADDDGKTQRFIDVVNALASVKIKNITMTGFRDEEEQIFSNLIFLLFLRLMTEVDEIKLEMNEFAKRQIKTTFNGPFI